MSLKKKLQKISLVFCFVYLFLSMVKVLRRGVRSNFVFIFYNIFMFLTPPDTTGVTQLFNQLNKDLQHEYRSLKENMFTDFNSLNNEVFMMILGRIWNNWGQKQYIVKAAGRLGVTSSS